MQERQNGRYINRGSEYYQPAPPRNQPAAPQPPQETPRTLKPAKQRSRKLLYFLTLLTVLAAATAAIMLYKAQGPLPPSVASYVTFPVYLPDTSRGVRIDQDSYSFQDGALTFTVRTPDNTQVFLSEQTVPKSFDLATFLQHMKSKQSVSNSYGAGQAGISENNLVISQIISGTWVFMSGPVDMKPTQLTYVFQSLQKY
jgi:hypothetical protein